MDTKKCNLTLFAIKKTIEIQTIMKCTHHHQLRQSSHVVIVEKNAKKCIKNIHPFIYIHKKSMEIKLLVFYLQFY